jgi:hypothetical protein
MSTTELRARARNGAAASWLIGVAAGVAVIASVTATDAGFSVTDKLPVETMLHKLDDASSGFLLGGGFQGLVAMGIVVYGAFVRGALLRREPEGALTPVVAWGGALLTAAMAGMGAAHTQLAASFKDAVDPAIPLTLHALEQNLFAGAFCAIALVAGAVAVAGLRRGAVARWFAGVSAFVAILLVVVQIAVPWAGWFPAAVWMIVSAFGLRDRS